MNDLIGPILRMIGNYDERNLGRYEKDDVFVSTVMVFDSDYPFETGVAHPKFNDNRIIVVENYTSKEKALAGQAKWIKIMTAKTLPESLSDVSGAQIRKLLSDNLTYKKKNTNDRH